MDATLKCTPHPLRVGEAGVETGAVAIHWTSSENPPPNCQFLILNMADHVLLNRVQQATTSNSGRRGTYPECVKSLCQSVDRCDREHDPSLSHHVTTNVRAPPHSSRCKTSGSSMAARDRRLSDRDIQRHHWVLGAKITLKSMLCRIQICAQTLRASRHISSSNHLLPSSNLVRGRWQVCVSTSDGTLNSCGSITPLSSPICVSALASVLSGPPPKTR